MTPTLLTSLTPQNSKALTAAMLLALKPVSDQFGVAFDLGGGSIQSGGSSADVRIRCVIAKRGESVQVSVFRAEGERLGFTLDMLNRRFVFQTRTYTLVGLLKTRTAFFAIGANAAGKEFKIPVVDALRALTGVTAPATSTPGEDEAVRCKVDAVLARLKTVSQSVDFSNRMKEEGSIFDDLMKISNEVGDGLKVGKMISYGVADGKAHYVIMGIAGRTVKVRHVAIGDAYRSEVVIGDRMSMAHAARAVAHADGMRQLFSQTPGQKAA